MKNLTMQILGLMFILVITSSCNKNDDPITPAPVAKEKYTVEYAIKSNESSPIFNVNAIYNDKDGKEKSVLVTEYPWKMSFKVDAPFTAKFKVIYTIKTGINIPENVIIARDGSFEVAQGGSIKKSSNFRSKVTMPKVNFNKYIKTYTIDFDFIYEIK